MGNLVASSYATNTVNDAVSQMLSVAVSVTQTCASTVNVSQAISADGCSGIVYNGITEDSVVQISTSCVDVSNIQNNISSEMTQTVKQISTAMTEALSLGTSQATNNLNLLTQLSQQITETFSQTCVQNLSSQQTINCTNSKSITFTNIEFKSALDGAVNCTMNTQSVNTLKQQLVQNISQSSKATTKGLLSIFTQLIIVILIIIGVFVVMGLKGFNTVTQPTFLITVAFLIEIAFLFSFFFGWFPFKKKSDANNAQEAQSVKEHNTAFLAALIGIMVVTLIFGFIVFSKQKQSIVAKTKR